MPKAVTKVADNTRIDKWVAQYIAIRERIKQMDALYKKQMEPFEKAKDKLAGHMLEFLDSTGQEMARTDEGTVYVLNQSRASLGDPDAFMEYVVKNSAYELMDRKANSTACREFAEEHGSLPPGVKLNSTRTVGVRA